MSMPARQARRYTAREVRQLIAAAPLATPRYELVDGELLVTPSPSRSHQEAVRLLLIALSAYLERNPVGHPVVSPSDVELETEDVRQPDIFVVPVAEWKRLVEYDWPARELSLAVEVLSASSARHDRVRKRPGYQRHVPEYWIVDLESRLVERWRHGDERPEIMTERLEWHPSSAASPFQLDLSAFFARVHSDEPRP
jgi:Uma2 family endonuclease